MTKKIKQPQSLFQSRPRTGEMVPQLGAQAAAVGFTSQHAHEGSQLSVVLVSENLTTLLTSTDTWFTYIHASHSHI